MLVLTRRAGQTLRIGDDIELQVVRIEGDRVVLGIVAPRAVSVIRGEVRAEVAEEILAAAAASTAASAAARDLFGKRSG
jgi:carbon storage regulator